LYLIIKTTSSVKTVISAGITEIQKPWMASGEHILVDWIRFAVFGSGNPLVPQRVCRKTALLKTHDLKSLSKAMIFSQCCSANLREITLFMFLPYAWC
jgi:hypothetical protein